MDAQRMQQLATEAIDEGMYKLTDCYLDEMRRAARLADEGKEYYQAISRVYHRMGKAAERFAEIHETQEEIRATWTEEQSKDWTFHDEHFDALSRESFYLMTEGRDTLTISQETIERVAEKATY